MGRDHLQETLGTGERVPQSEHKALWPEKSRERAEDVLIGRRLKRFWDTSLPRGTHAAFWVVAAGSARF